MRLSTARNFILGAILLILLLVSGFAIYNISILSQELSTVTNLHQPVREKLMKSKELLLFANIAFHAFQENDYTAGEDSLALLHRIQASIEQIPPGQQYASERTRVFSSVQRILILLNLVLEKGEPVQEDSIVTNKSLLKEIQKETNEIRNSLHIIAENSKKNAPELLSTSQHNEILARLINMFETEATHFLTVQLASIHKVIHPLNLCVSNLKWIYSISQTLEFSPTTQKETLDLIALLESYKSAVVLFDDEVKLDVSGENLFEITSLVTNAQQKSNLIFETLNDKLLDKIDTIQKRASASLTLLEYTFVLVSLLAVFLAIGLSVWFSSYLSRRFDNLISGAEKIGQGQLDFRFNHLQKENDQFDRLAGVFNMMATALQKRDLEITRNIDSLARSQKLEAVGSLAGGIAHDFNNILTAIMGYALLLQENIPKSETSLQSDIAVIVSSSRRAKDLIYQLLSFSRLGKGEQTPLDLAPLIKETIKLLTGAASSRVDLDYHIDQSCTVMADSTQIYQVLTNIGTNAIQAMEKEGGELKLRLKEATLSESDVMAYYNAEAGRHALISISDTGPGIAPEHIDRIFDPYFTTKEFGKGTGMGLFVTYGIIEKHNGIIKVNSDPGHGTTFDIFLPISEESSTELISDNHQKVDFSEGTETILFVDDEKHIRDMGKRILEESGYTVKTAENGLVALNLLKQDISSFDLVITDQSMPEMTGIELVKNIQELDAKLPVMMITGYSEHVPEEEAFKSGVREYIHKPFDKQILNKIRKVLDESHQQ